MNILIDRLRQNDFPILFRFENLFNIGLNKEDVNVLLNEAIKYKWIDNIYEDIYTLGYKYRKAFVPEGILAQMIDPQSYVSFLYILSDYGWIPEAVYNIISVTDNKDMIVWTKKNGGFKYRKLYNNIPLAGIYVEDYGIESYKKATPLRALCDYVYLFNCNWDKIDYLEDHLRIKMDSLEELKAGDFDELQDVFKIPNVENFLVGIRKELGL